MNLGSPNQPYHILRQDSTTALRMKKISELWVKKGQELEF